MTLKPAFLTLSFFGLHMYSNIKRKDIYIRHIYKFTDSDGFILEFLKKKRLLYSIENL